MNSHPNFGGETVLLLTRDLERRTFIRDLLYQQGYCIVEAANENHAEMLSRQLNRKIDLIVTDATSSEIAMWASELACIPAILRLTDSTSAEDELCPNHRTAAFLHNAASADEIASKLRSVLCLSKRRKKVLIVDADQALLRMAAALLEAAGYTVSQTSKRKEALDYVSKLKPDVVLTELVMPEIEGLELIQQLLELDPRLSIVAMSGGYRAENYLHVARLLGARITLLKPLTGELLLQVVRDMAFER